MGLLKILKKLKETSKEMRVLILGLDNAGKTTILKKFNGEDIDEISPTLGFNIKTLEFEQYRLNVWDVGGQKTIRAYWRNYFESTDALIWVVDSSDKIRLEDCNRELHALLKQEKLCGASLLIFCNKQDIEYSMTCDQIREFLELESMSNRHWSITACSAKTGDGLYNGISWMVHDVSSRLYVMN